MHSRKVVVDHALICHLKTPMQSVCPSKHVWQHSCKPSQVYEQDTSIPIEFAPGIRHPVHFRANCHDFWQVQFAGIEFVVEHDVCICVQGYILIDVGCYTCSKQACIDIKQACIDIKQLWLLYILYVQTP